MPFLDDQIQYLKEELEKMNALELTPELIVEETFKPKDEISEKIVKYDCKVSSCQDIITNGLTSVNSIDDMGQQLLFIR